MTDDPINYPQIKLTTGICPLLTWTHMHMNAVPQIHPVIKLPVKDNTANRGSKGQWKTNLKPNAHEKRYGQSFHHFK